MKLKYVVVILIIVVLGIGGYCFVKYKEKNKTEEVDLSTSNIKSFYLTYTNGYMINSYTRYQLSLEDDKYNIEIKPYGIDEEDKLNIEVTTEFIEELSKILKKYAVNKWDGFDKTNQGVLDGDSFSFSMSFNNGKSIHATGYMKWPSNYHLFESDISTLFMDIYNKNT